MKRIAITGGIGSGKSTVLTILKEKGYPVFSCDEIYKKVITDKEYIRQVGLIFPGVIKNGEIDRKILAEIVFSDDENRKKLEAIAHPLIMSEVNKEISLLNNDISFVEVPLLFEGGYISFFDGIIVVKRNKDLRIEAVRKRDNLEKNAIEKRISSQFDYDSVKNECILKNKKIKIIMNDSSIEDLNKQIDFILNEIT